MAGHRLCTHQAKQICVQPGRQEETDSPPASAQKGRGTHAIPTAAGCPWFRRPGQAGQEDLQGNSHTGQATSIWAGCQPQGWQGASRRQQRGSPGQDLQGPGSTQPQHVLTASESHEHVPSPQATCVTGLMGLAGDGSGDALSSCRVGFLGVERPTGWGSFHTRAPLSPLALPRPLPLPVLSKRGRFHPPPGLSPPLLTPVPARNHGSPWTSHSLAATAQSISWSCQLHGLGHPFSPLPPPAPSPRLPNWPTPTLRAPESEADDAETPAPAPPRP